MVAPKQAKRLGWIGLWCGIAGLVGPPLLAVVTILAVETITGGRHVPNLVEKVLVAAVVTTFGVLELAAGVVGYLSRQTPYGVAGLCLFAVGVSIPAGAAVMAALSRVLL